MKKKDKSVNMGKYGAVILDLDGVITRTARVHANAWKQMFDDFLQHLNEQESKMYEPFDVETDYLQYVDGKPRYEGVRSFLKSRGIRLPEGTPEDEPEKETICGLGNRKNKIFLKLIDENGVDIYQDTVEKVRTWKREGKKTAVVSSSKNCAAILKAADLSDLFDVRIDGVISLQMNLKGKPAPDIFLKAAQQLGVSPLQCVVVEDAIAGVQAGRAGHFGLVIGLNRQGQTDELLNNGADVVVDSLKELGKTRQKHFPPAATSGLPSALDHKDEIFASLHKKKPAVFLDYDGTLTPIVKKPEDAVLSENMRRVLQQLAMRCKTAIVSGRDRADVEKLVGLKELYYAGSHGFDITGPGGLHMQQEDGKKSLPALDTAEEELRGKLKNIPGMQVERKRFSIAVHFRNASPQKIPQLMEIVDRTLHSHSGLKKGSGKKIVELQPDIDWDKGKAVFWLLEKLELNSPDVLPIYMGDDLTDENAFTALEKQGVSILVGDHGKPSHAQYGLNNVDEVKDFLYQLSNELEVKENE